jgi:hypothetical protein
MSNKVALELLRDFFVMLGPKRPNGLYDFKVTPLNGSKKGSHVFSFELPDELKSQLNIKENMLPLKASSLENLILSYMSSEGEVNQKFMSLMEFLSSLPDFKKKIDNYFENQNISIIFDFK